MLVRLIAPYLFPVVWLAFLLYWQLMATNVKATTRLEPAGSRLLRVGLFLIAIVLLSWETIPVDWLRIHIVPGGRSRFWTGITVTVAGLLFAVWARVHLGRNWSRSVTLKRDHELITSGPYALVRHPIYTGILSGFLGTALAIGEVRGVLALAIFTVALSIKLRLEEKWMRGQFGDAYAVYSSRVHALVPFVL
jgi:protein-S-isoprenylcysteine O-methyltransferase Ste14